VRRVQNALSAAPFDDLGFARVDTHRHLRQGFPEVILGTGKTPAQIAAIAARISSHGHSLLVTRASKEAFEAVRAVVSDAEYRDEARAIVARRGDIAPGTARCWSVCAGHVDLPVAEEAASPRRSWATRWSAFTTSASPGCTACSASTIACAPRAC
jgi:NCAIR mutase (PurE)-related protein